MKIVTIICYLLFSVSLQKSANINLTGTWKVSEVIADENSPIAKNPSMMSMIRTMMLKTNYTFLADHHFKVTGMPNAEKVPDGIWSYDAKTGKVTVKDALNPKAHVVNMLVSKDAKGQVLFKMLDAPVTLKVYKL